MDRRSLRMLGIGSAIGGGFALVVLLCLGVALVRSITPIPQLTEEARIAATQSAIALTAETSVPTLTATLLLPTQTHTATDMPPPTDTPGPWPTLSGTLPSTGTPGPSPTLSGTPPSTGTPGPSPTLSGTPPSTDTPGPLPIPTDTPPPGSTPVPIFIQGATTYVAAAGLWHVVGEVVNNSSGSIGFVKVVGTFYDAGGNIVASDFTYTLLDAVGADGVAPFDLDLESPSSIDHYDLQVEYETTDSPPLRVEVVGNDASFSDDGSYHVVGQVRNQNAVAVNLVKVVVTFYNARNEVVRTGFSNISLDPLDPGEESSFDVALLDPPADIDHYALSAQAQ